MSFVAEEIAGQPACWERAVGEPFAPGERIAVVGCGTSWFVAMAYAALRQATGQWTDAFAASEALVDRGYDRVVAITRSGTTTEVVDLLARVAVPTTVITGVAGSPATARATETVLLDFADERSVVQTQFATTALAYLRSSLGEDLTKAIADARTVLDQDLGDLDAAEQFTFLGQGWTVGLAHEAALKLREAAGLWTESYPAMEYRHGPISIAQPGRVTWVLGQAPDGLQSDVESTGARYIDSGNLDPMAHLVLAQRVAVAAALRRGLDPDRPRNLTRSVILGA
ncbi:SIS domain-containing protein [Actinokineospora diospyrosa]|uniref:Fructoselysine-6-P-deglycase FrlB with duplicated sugar isomerase (SIS) domain n=1 Tax=Actinokineospora diospyrosa TaxID=103728 RepID=A0ABT1IA88_9PSEU|nr:sugar isomerase [Actinokineospora diospyrosa]MCP2269546.1 Fructoselysine-6-P-deglycase FrlB with duplicated sugar isomerase (SIS) domain [Actinokineospora diospyrosa]